MDAIIDSPFERVERALATLLNSIATYNPAPAFANDLVAADTELSRSLELLSTHQANYAKIVSLRETSAALDNQIRENLLLLTDTRKELLETKSTVFPSNAHPVSYSELLTYARRISRFTQPPTRPELQAQPIAEPDGAGNATPKEASQSQTNGSTPAAATNGAVNDGQAMVIDGATPAAGSTQPQTQNSQLTTATTNTSNTALPEVIAAYYNSKAGLFFVPWPTDDQIRGGSLASIQTLVTQGIDPATFDPERVALEEREEKERKEENERLRIVEEEERKMEMQRRMSGVGSGSGGMGERREETKVFQLDDFEDDEDDI